MTGGPPTSSCACLYLGAVQVRSFNPVTAIILRGCIGNLVDLIGGTTNRSRLPIPLEGNRRCSIDVCGKRDVIAGGRILISQFSQIHRRVTDINTNRLAGHLPKGVAYSDLIHTRVVERSTGNSVG